MLKRSLNSFRYAFQGILLLFRTQPNARIHLLATILVTAAGLYFGISNSEWCLIILAIAMVLAAESFNTALEHLTDLVSPEHHPLAGNAKDAAAAAVLFTAAGALVIGLIIFLPRVLFFLGFVK